MIIGNVQQLYIMKATLSPAEVAAATSAEQTFTLKGLRLTTDMIVSVSKPTTQAGLGIAGWRISANDTVGITFMNATAAAITPTASQEYQFLVARCDGQPKAAIAR